MNDKPVNSTYGHKVILEFYLPDVENVFIKTFKAQESGFNLREKVDSIMSVGVTSDFNGHVLFGQSSYTGNDNYKKQGSEHITLDQSSNFGHTVYPIFGVRAKEWTNKRCTFTSKFDELPKMLQSLDDSDDVDGVDEFNMIGEPAIPIKLDKTNRSAEPDATYKPDDTDEANKEQSELLINRITQSLSIITKRDISSSSKEILEGYSSSRTI
ncbi:hypothetical protein COEREDRAFT_87672 [Coemansia reversa NRRL 1564]|uniref:Uncharacterized protein n=1 Tax=Coemansia reversa (strain ATCC 12441 / NRRL 1564) TaxID=763665 RepID=A0A2G5B9L6_COERN|nr:hypothetical protein COEREDRAFT_87672 [Coemansia reversa NRRL 1564]|eukprot:PIA15713.1 hypothetical protein COEREDRAFT_87672 [Coemansia reversa NRRL 1564]